MCPSHIGKPEKNYPGAKNGVDFSRAGVEEKPRGQKGRCGLKERIYSCEEEGGEDYKDLISNILPTHPNLCPTI